ncbi:unnamed protein product [Aphanomyces euteiches]|uniref:Phosphatidylserine decarboxylase proenzyme, mitochondrial n=1 Tax=Aphanomyces euteiches TaxID=100861 RepID=A0A6G0WW33_9STRA|nr:hypothetical protein Ae201684_011057 [Aphanomyces euteiches]KAH9058483.1 hypothetical protein Ae201684P_005826 [Aphanomyces euteiches]KAH9132846.1 hypothetical protein AeRB84_020910 [Aphanomyces euteiches]
MHRVLLRAKSVRFHSTKATSAEAKKPPRSLWPTAIGSAAGAYVAYEAWKRWDDNEKNPARVFHRLPGEKTEEEKKLASEPQMFLLHLVSYRTISRLWGAVNEIELPTFLREPIYNAWTKAFDCKLDEMKYPLEHYKNLSEFFSRPLKDGIRPINWDSRCMSSPVDGTMATYGVVDFTDDIPVLEQIKGVRYRMDEFLGAAPDFFLAPPSPGKKLFHCVIYLAPGDYHRIHSPIDWSMGERRHFPGDLWPVNKLAVTSVPSLFTWNERVALLGRWKHGFFSMSLVGATNVGSMTLDVEPDFATNKLRDFYLTKEWGSCDTKKYESQQLVTRGDQVAQFKLGSTVVLVFEAPDDFKFTSEPGDKVRYGASIGHFERAADADGSTFPSTSEMIRLANQGSDEEKTSYLGEISRSISQVFFGPRKASADLQAEKSEPSAQETK